MKGKPISMRTNKLSRFGAIALIAAVSFTTACGTSTASVPTATEATGSASQTLAALPVKGKAPKTGYSRDQFGSAWKDINGNGCDTRNDILIRDLMERGMNGNCTVMTGVLYPDPYTGKNITFTRGKSTVDIDHVVALGNAWVTGAFQWDATKRLNIANDPLNLLAVDYSANRQKGDADTATWLPPNKSYRCAYVARQIAVKAKYGLWVTQPEKNAMSAVLSSCPNESLPTSDTSAIPVPVPTTPQATIDKPSEPSTAPTGSTPSPVRYANCTAAKAAGVTPILRDQNPELYNMNTHLDRDKDGRACT